VQIVLGATSVDDPALAVARHLAAAHPRADIAIVVGRSPTCSARTTSLDRRMRGQATAS
jgi:hypothetical protein